VIRERLIRKSKTQSWLAQCLEVSEVMFSAFRWNKESVSQSQEEVLDTFQDCEFDDLFVIKGRK